MRLGAKHGAGMCRVHSLEELDRLIHVMISNAREEHVTHVITSVRKPSRLGHGGHECLGPLAATLSRIPCSRKLTSGISRRVRLKEGTACQPLIPRPVGFVPLAVQRR
jgi:hypothetical protein